MASLVRAAATVLVLPITTRVLSPGALGVTSIAAVVSMLIVAVGALGLHSAANREYFGHDGGASDPRLGRTLSVAALAAVTITAVAVHLAGPTWARLFDQLSYDRALQLAVVTAVPMVLVVVSQNLLRAEDRPIPFVAIALVSTIGGQLLGLALAGYHDGDPAWYLGGVLAGYAAGGIAGAVAVRLWPGRLHADELGRALRIGLPTVPHSVGIFLLATGDRLVVEHLLGVSAVGRYQVAYLVGSAGVVLVMAFNAAWAPLVFGADPKDRSRTLHETTAASARLLALVAGAIGVGAPLALLVAAPGEYDAAALVTTVAIIAPSGFFYARYQAAALTLVADRRTMPLAFATPLAAVVNLGANLLLIPHYGLEGAAIATTASYALWAFVVERAAARSIPGPMPRWLPDLGLAGVGLILGVWLPTSGVWSVLRFVLLAAVVWRGIIEIRRMVRF